MNQSEFDQWLEDYFAVFPAAREWLAKVSGIGAGNEKQATGRMARTLKGWQKTLSRTPQIYAARVTDQMLSGRLDPVEAFEREKTALIVRKAAADMIEADREERVRAKRYAEDRQAEGNKSRRYKYGMGEVYRAYLRMIESGDREALTKMYEMADEWPEARDQGHAAADGYGELFAS